ncbi:hypothetical protein MKW98_032091 [Papaver atlanticum]|uniref:Uncharacterized protein n=1 Tax=Papaver atlanticum TaxID=357466 RepID=A0AAD4XEG9_9MAGN|nr:hypothetical protein MKW98_032091 [Papaver atlanticum]
MAAENTDTFLSSITEKVRSIETLYEILRNQNWSISPTLDEETRLGIKKRTDDLTQQATVIVQSPLKALEEQCFKPPLKKCQKCGKLKIAGRQVLNIVDAVRRFRYFGSQHQQPSETTLVSDSDNEDGYSGIQHNSIAIVQKWKSSQATTMEDERQQSDWEDFHGAHQSLSLTNRKTQHRKGYGGSKEVGPRRQSYNNSWKDVILAPTLMHFEPERVNSGSSSDSSTGSGSRRSCSSASYSYSYVGSNSQSRSRRTPTSSRYSVYSASAIVSGTSGPIYGESSGSDWESYSRNGMLDHRSGYRSRRRSPSEAYSRSSSRSISRSRGRSQYSKGGPSNPSNEKMGWFRRAKNKIGNMFHHHSDHHHHPRDDTDVSTSREDWNACAHHRSTTRNPGNNVVLHRQSKEQKVTKNKKRTPVKNKHGLTGGFFSHFWSSKKTKPSTADKRRLERTVTGKGKVTAKKLDWLENIHRRRLPGGTKFPKSKRGKPNNKLKKLT